jgi:4-aminobutyrate aminotransferase-like enzyme/Ser/Thr protein kinase RdoA (MazF antagonist)
MALLDHKPHFSSDDAMRLVRELYGTRVTASPLPSERDLNFLVQTATSEKFVFKIANGLEDRSMLVAQQRAMTHIGARLSHCPRVVASLEDTTLTEVESREGKRHLAWMITFLPGVPLATVARHSPGLLRDIGRRIGQIDRALQDFDDPALHRDFYWDLANGQQIVRDYQSLVPDNEMRPLVVRLSAEFERAVAPLLAGLRRSAIYSDANDYNILVGGGDDTYSRNQSVTGIVDFGDMVHSHTINDLAIAIAYAILDKPHPLAAAMEIVRGYHAEYALTEDEIAALFGLVCMRLCMSVCIAAHQQQQRPDDQYLAISQQPIRRTLPLLAKSPSRFAEAAFRQACGLEPARSSKSISTWLRANSNLFSPVLDYDLKHERCLVFNLGVDSPVISGDENENSEPKLTERLFGLMKSANVRVGVGRYDEARLLYTTPAFAGLGGAFDEHRTIHLGIDLFVESGSPIYAPIAGEVHAFHNNAAPLDYGPNIIIKHKTGEGREFFTLYGHLSLESLDCLYVGKPVAQGERIAWVGAPPINGDWTPHLHFQLIIDLLDLDCDYPGVCRDSEKPIWHSLSPDPNLILGIPAERFPDAEPDRAATLAARRNRVGRNLSLAYREPIKIARGWMQYLFDETGRRYLDAYNNVPHVGHCHPRIVKAAADQMRILNTNTRYLSDLINRYAEKLCETLPEPLSVCFFVNSASEANELAIRLARSYTGQRDTIVLESAYHGHTNTLIDVSPYKHDGPGGSGPPEWVHTAPIPDTYRGIYKRDDPKAGEKYASHVRLLIEEVQKQGKNVAAFLAETCPSVGGQVFMPPGYLAAVYGLVRQAGGVCIADEVQSSYGRIGTHFWAFEEQGVVPDIVVIGKPMGNGHPIGAIITTPDIAESFDNGMEFFSTFGGNTVSCAVGLAVLDVIKEERLQEHALKVGDVLLSGLRPLMDRFSIVGDVRGSGLFLGVELVRDRETLEPAAEEAGFVMNRLKERGVLSGTDGPFHNVIKIRPPMPFDERDASFLLETLDTVLASDFAGR